MAARGGKKVVIIKKKVAGGGGHHGGSWKVAYADFVTAMMAFFMVMWILGMDDQTKQAIEGYFANPVGYKKGYGSGSSPLATGTSMSTVTKTPLRVMSRNTEKQTFEALRRTIIDKVSESDSLQQLKGVVDVQVTPDGLRIELVESGSGDVYFPLGSAKMKAATALTLELVGEELAKLQHPVILEGHTDAAKFDRDAAYTNWELSTDRANASRRVLLAAGLEPTRIREVRGYADTRLRIPNDATAPANRRISILLPYTDMPSTPEESREMAAAKRDSIVASLQNPIQRNY